MRDLIAWDEGLRSGAILSSRSWEQVYDPVKLNSGNRYPYGFGWSVDALNGSRRLHHSGSWQGFKSYISRYLGEDLTIIVLANLAESDPGRFVDGIAGVLDPALAPAELTAIPDREPEVRARLDTLLRLRKMAAFRRQSLRMSAPDFFQRSLTRTRNGCRSSARFSKCRFSSARCWAMTGSTPTSLATRQSR